MREDREDIEEVRDRLGPTPRKRSLLEFLFLRGYTPTWFLQTGAFADVSGKQGMLLRHGDVVWATIVQANQFLFKSGLWNHPATIAYSPEPCFDGDIAGLTSIGHRLAGLKHTAPADPEEQKYARMITAEACAMWVMAPSSITGGRDVISTTVMVYRKHLPLRYLTGFQCPLLIHRDTPATMIVPSRYWPSRLLERWQAPVAP